MNLARVRPLNDGRFALDSPFDKRLIEVVKAVPGMVWVPRERAWCGYRDALKLVIPRLEEANLAKVTKADVIEAAAPIRVPLSSSRLRDYQRIGVEFIVQRASTGVLLADSMGLGKSAVALAAITALNAFPALVVCPANVKYGWEREAEKMSLPPPLVLSTKKPWEGATISKEDGIVIINYDILTSWLPNLQGTKTIVFDEAQMLSNHKSQRSKAAKTLSHRATNRIALSGTPMMNVPIELWNVIDTISPNRFGKQFDFGFRYANFHQEEIEMKRNGEVETKKVWKYDGSSNLDELQVRLSDMMLRRTKQDVALELPPKTRQLVELDVTREYHNADHWWSIDNKNAAQVALGIAGQLKIPAAADLAEQSRAEGNHVVIFCFQKAIAKELIKALAKKGISAYPATGDESDTRRRENAFRCRDEGGVLVATIDSMGTGVDYLSYANVLIFCELHYVPGRLLQAEDRAHRFGQKSNVHCYYLVAIGTIDEAIRDRLRVKLRYFEDAVGTTGEQLRDDLIGESDEQALEAVKQMALEMERRHSARMQS
jgi:SWI/SNF-related matrix-associated actin-dependent regulator of chromatin subfamily A-like protein 1